MTTPYRAALATIGAIAALQGTVTAAPAAQVLDVSLDPYTPSDDVTPLLSGANFEAANVAQPSADDSAPSLMGSDDLGSTASPGPMLQSASAYGGAGVRVAAGMTAGDLIKPSTLPVGDYFSGFDIRTSNPAQYLPSGYVPASAFTDVSMSAAVSDASDGLAPQVKSGTITRDSELKSALSFASKASGTGWGAKATATFGYSTESESESHLVSGYTYGVAYMPGRVLGRVDLLRLVPDAREALMTDIDRFLDTYGTHYIKAKRYGCEASTSYTYRCTTDQAKKKIASSLQASYNGGSFSGSTQLKQQFDSFSKVGLCTRDVNVNSIGIPIDGQPLTDGFIDAFWNGFTTQCQAAHAKGQSKIVYVEVGSWMEVTDVQAALRELEATNPAKAQLHRDMLLFYGQMQQRDFEAFSLGGMYQGRVQKAIERYREEYANPWANVHLIGRDGAPSDPIFPTYWQQLPANHAAMIAKFQAINIYNYSGREAAHSAVASKTPGTTVAQKFFNDMMALYWDAASTYQHVHSSVSVVTTTFARDNISLRSDKFTVPAARSRVNPQPGYPSPNDKYVGHMMTEAGNVPLSVSLNVAPSATGWGTRMYMCMHMLDAYAKYQYVYNCADTEALLLPYPHVVGSTVDITDVKYGIHQRCPSCPEARADVTVHYIMKDLTFDARPSDLA